MYYSNGKCSCTGKDGRKKRLYATEFEAIDTANYQSRLLGVQLRVYECSDERGWHITSN